MFVSNTYMLPRNLEGTNKRQKGSVGLNLDRKLQKTQAVVYACKPCVEFPRDQAVLKRPLGRSSDRSLMAHRVSC